MRRLWRILELLDYLFRVDLLIEAGERSRRLLLEHPKSGFAKPAPFNGAKAQAAEEKVVLRFPVRSKQLIYK